MLNASVGVQRVLGRVRRTSLDSIIAMPRPNRSRSSADADRTQHGYVLTSRHIYPLPRPRRRRLTLLPALVLHRPQLAVRRPSLRLRRFSTREIAWILSPVVRRSMAGIGHDRVVAIAAAGILLSASFLSVTPGGPRGDTGGPTGDGPGPRLAIAGTSNDEDTGSIVEDYVNTGEPSGDATGDGQADTASMTEGYLGSGLDGMNRFEEAVALGGASAHIHGPFLEDGTLLKPVAVDTSVPDGSDLLRSYKVKSGDTLATIANKFDISMMTLWWANKLKSKNELHVGQQLRIPPVSGVVVEVTPNDTLTGLAAKYRVDENDILTTNGLDDRNLVVGQVLMLPGALGSEIRVPAAKRSTHPKSLVTRPTVHRSTGGGGRSAPPPSHYSGGRMLWPTTSHHISQYFHYGHYAIDIDGNTGDPIWAAASGTVIFAGWKNNGGGYQVWIAHGSGLYTTYNHMSSVSVGRGQHVSKGQRVGRMGATGFATGSHLHFEVWRGPIWNGGVRVNPLRYL